MQSSTSRQADLMDEKIQGRLSATAENFKGKRAQETTETREKHLRQKAKTRSLSASCRERTVETGAPSADGRARTFGSSSRGGKAGIGNTFNKWQYMLGRSDIG